ncbi:serine/threonine protein kinase [Actinomyces bowdenii]|uniref:serine/threonine-protein kinase n=1 Tax=Actinomyces bowdenii TaxID=131109 RepID=UPI001ABCD05F|nr:serine/threonine-protein kinase [Actinomyces bowdenii]MBO3724332.1 serine/threonine protein kinase [Actinomyces bowdenii]
MSPQAPPGSRPDLADTLSTPFTIPGVQLHSVLGRGGFAVVYAGVQDSLARPVAVKIDSRPLDDPRNERRFMREVQAASRITGHPHVVSLVDTGVLPDNRPYLVMEMCAGGSLADLVAKGPTAPADAVALVEAASSGLGAAHAAGVMHRDVKPANILLDAYGSPRLSDFGIASVEREGQDPTVTLECLTPDFAPPEAFMLSRPGPEGDVWSMGAVLFALLTGRGPRRGPDGAHRSLPEIVRSLEDPLNLRDPRIPAPLLGLLEACMAPEPEDRLHDGRELTAALARVRAGLGQGRLTVGGPVTTVRLAEAGLAALPVAGAANHPAAAAIGPAGPPGAGGPGASSGPGAAMSARSLRRTRLRAAVVGLAIGLILGTSAGWGVSSAVQSGTAQGASQGAGAAGADSGDVAAGSGGQGTAQDANGGGQRAGQSGDGSQGDAAVAGAQGDGSPQQASQEAPPHENGTCLTGIVSVSGYASARPTSCQETHSWQVFAVGALDPSTTGVSTGDLEADPQVQATCTEQAARDAGALNPEIEVLGPSQAQWEARGARGFSCVYSER